MSDFLTERRAKSWPKGRRFVTGSPTGDRILKYYAGQMTKAEKTAAKGDLGEALKMMDEKNADRQRNN